jgi:hypothetical protein
VLGGWLLILFDDVFFERYRLSSSGLRIFIFELRIPSSQYRTSTHIQRLKHLISDWLSQLFFRGSRDLVGRAVLIGGPFFGARLSQSKV